MSTGDKITISSDPWDHWSELGGLLAELGLRVEIKGQSRFANPESDAGYQILAAAMAFCTLATTRKGERCIGTNYFRLAKYILLRPTVLDEFLRFVRHRQDQGSNAWTMRIPRGYSNDNLHSQLMRYLVATQILRTTDQLVYEGKNVYVLDDAFRHITKNSAALRTHISALDRLHTSGSNGIVL